MLALIDIIKKVWGCNPENPTPTLEKAGLGLGFLVLLGFNNKSYISHANNQDFEGMILFITS